MLFERSDFCQPSFRRFNGSQQLIPLRCFLISQCLQLIQTADLIITQKQQCLGHLLQVINRSPPGITWTFFFHFGLDVYDEIYGSLASMEYRSFDFMLPLAGDNCADISFRISVTE